MRFRLAHKLVTFLLPTVAVGTAATSGEVPIPTLAAFFLAVCLAWFSDAKSRIGSFMDRAFPFFSLTTVLLLALAVFQVARDFPEVTLDPFLNFVLFLVVAKLAWRRSNRDHLQLFVLSFITMLAAAWMATHVLFLVGFGLFVVLSTWALVLFHLRREIEDNYLVRHKSENMAEEVTADRVLGSRRVVGSVFFLGTGGVALLVFLGAGLVFLSVPRLGMGFVLGGIRRPGAVAGFSDEVKLGQRGTISTNNQTVILRATIPSITEIPNETQRDEIISRLYWRGTVYDTYFEGEWRRSRATQTRTLIANAPTAETYGRTYLLSDPLEERPQFSRKKSLQAATVQKIEIVGIAHPVAFALDRPVAIEIPAPSTGSFLVLDAEPRFGGEMNLRYFRVKPHNPFSRTDPVPDFFGAKYVAYSRPHAELAQEVSYANEKALSPSQLSPYLALPMKLSQRLRDLARRITDGKSTPQEKTAAVLTWLQTTHRYSTTLGRNERIADPLEDFLLEQTVGHCEYFAASAAVLLRIAGVPTRYVNGFLGGEWNAIQQMITVRENRAHAWIEAYMGKAGWVRVDATPPQNRTAHMNRFRQFYDAAELFFSRWILEYNASAQLRLAKQLGGYLGVSHKGSRIHKPSIALTRGQILSFVLAGCAAFLLWRYRKTLGRMARRMPKVSGRAATVHEPAILRLYASTLHRLAQQGLPRKPSETPHEYLHRVRAHGVQGDQILVDLTRAYAEARYGARPIPHDLVARLEQDATTIRPAA